MWYDIVYFMEEKWSANAYQHTAVDREYAVFHLSPWCYQLTKTVSVEFKSFLSFYTLPTIILYYLFFFFFLRSTVQSKWVDPCDYNIVKWFFFNIYVTRYLYLYNRVGDVRLVIFSVDFLLFIFLVRLLFYREHHEHLRCKCPLVGHYYSSIVHQFGHDTHQIFYLRKATHSVSVRPIGIVYRKIQRT